ncbi:MAG: DUF389 domain-containing protein [Dokdonia sp.]|jgi:uncharacterized hydrophobic protein (TIGR00271 family)
MMEEQKTPINAPNTPNTDPNQKEDLRSEALSVWEHIKKFLNDLLDIRQDTDRDATIEAVRKDIPFKGHNAWILIFSIFVASIGLNVSSTAVVIGAMLISPLMGPIVGIGLSTAINDGDMMKRSFLNLTVMIILSVTTAFIYFSFSPLKELTPELEARTYPTILDVLVAIFGGLALIVAKTKSGTIASVIFGVAIATALMPPLCTVGYGLAQAVTANPEGLNYAFGAMYLFLINTIFIALATFIVSKLLRFPLVKYANQKKRKRVATIATIVAILVLAPSVVLFYNLLQKQLFIGKATEFITEVIINDGTEIIKQTEDPLSRQIDVYLIGNLVPQNKINEWERKLTETEGLELSTLVVHQGADQANAMAERLSSEVRSGILEELYVKNTEALVSKDAQIAVLEQEVTQLRGSAIPFQLIRNEAKINYDGLTQFGYATLITSNFENDADTLAVVRVRWADSISQSLRQRQESKMREWLKTRFELDTLVVEGNRKQD